METNNTHGGKREGSGRKSQGGTTVIRVRTDLPPAIERLKVGLSSETTETVSPRLLELQRM